MAEPIITSIWLPLPSDARRMLREIHQHAMKQDPRITNKEKVFAAMLFSSVIGQLHAQAFPKLIQEPGGVVGGNAPVNPQQKELELMKRLGRA